MTELLRRWLAIGVVLAIAVGIVVAEWLAAACRTAPRLKALGPRGRGRCGKPQ